MQIVTERKQERLLHKTDFTSRAVSRGREFYRSSSFWLCGVFVAGPAFSSCGARASHRSSPFCRGWAPGLCAQELRPAGRRPRGLACGILSAPGRARVACSGRKILMRITTWEAGSFDFLTPCFLLCLLVDMPTMGTICAPAGTPEFLF